MPEWILKGGEKPPKDMVNFLAENRENYLRVNMEVETSHERLRRSFHVLLRHWFESGEWSCNGAEIYSYEKFKNYYKYVGCDYKGIGYAYNGDTFVDHVDKKTKGVIQDALSILFEAYPDAIRERISPVVKSWTKMTKKEKSSALNLLLTEIRLSMTNNQKVLEWVAKITCDIEMLNDINYYKNIGE